MQRALVTGGAGFIGPHATAALLRAERRLDSATAVIMLGLVTDGDDGMTSARSAS